MTTREEKLKFSIEAGGSEDVRKLTSALDALEKEFADAGPEAKAMLDELRKLTELSRMASGFTKLKAEVHETGDSIALAKLRATELQQQFDATAAPTAKLTRELDRAKKAVSDLVATENRQSAELQRTRNAMAAAGLGADQLGAAQATLKTRIAQTTDELRDFSKETDKSEGSSSRFGSALMSIGRVAAGAAAAGLAAVAGLFKAVVGEADQIEQSVNQLNAALASTGNVAGFTAEQLLKMADAFENSSMFSREEIIGAQTRLLSYTDVVGEQFPAAMQIVIDQAARLGISVEQSAEVVGKALQTPSKAMEALGRQGFKLADGQKELLERLEATGKTAEAQSMIMDMLSESYGGAAAAQRVGTIAGLWKGLRDAVGDFLERIGNAGPVDYFKGKLQEVSNLIAGWASDGSLQRWAENTGRALTTVAQTTSTVFNGLLVAFNTARTGIHSAAAAIATALGWVIKGFAKIKELDFQDKLSAQFAGVKSGAEQLNEVADSLFASAKTNYEQAGESADALVKALDNLVNSASEVGSQVGQGAPAAQTLGESLKLSGAQADVARKQFEALPLHLQRMIGPALEAKGVLTGLTAITANSAAAFKDQQQQIQLANQRVVEARAALVALAKSGETNADAFSRANSELQRAEAHLAKVSQQANVAKVASGELGLAFKELGLKSQAEFEAIAKKHREALDTVQQSYLAGEASLQDVVRAFATYASSARAAAADGTAAMKQQVEQQLQVEAAALRLSDTLLQTGEVGKDAGAKTAKGFEDAASKIDDAAKSAEKLKKGADDATEGLDGVATAASRATTQISSAGIGLGFMTDEVGRALAAARGFDGVNLVLARYKDQIFNTRAELEAFTKAQQDAANAAAEAADEIEKMTEQLAAQRDAATLSAEDQEERRYQKEIQRIKELQDAAGYSATQQAVKLRGLAEAEHRRKLAEIKERTQAELASAKTVAEQNDQANRSRGGSSANGGNLPARPASSGTQDINLNVTVNGSSAGQFDPSNPRFEREVSEAFIRTLKTALRSSGGRRTW